MAQPPVLAPTADLTIPTGAVLHYASIQIPAGVTVRFVGSQPALVRCDGDARIDGVMSVSGGAGLVPGASNLGTGSTGSYCWQTGATTPAGPGRHRGFYGSDMPFSLLGGSPGGALNNFTTQLGSGLCNSLMSVTPGGPPGGTLVLRAAGRIDVRGSVVAHGGLAISAGAGSGGSILLAGMTGLRVWTGATVAATTWLTTLNQGYVRLDAAQGPPVVDPGSTVVPLLAVELPHVRAGTPRIGLTWDLTTHGEAGQWVVLYLGAPIPPTPTPFGVLGIDPGLAVDLGVAAPVGPFEDPSATLGLAIPAAPQLVGATLHVQGAGLFSSGQLRLSNRLVSTVQN
jgi:hypothetical protein